MLSTYIEGEFFVVRKPLACVHVHHCWSAIERTRVRPQGPLVLSEPECY